MRRLAFELNPVVIVEDDDDGRELLDELAQVLLKHDSVERVSMGASTVLGPVITAMCRIGPHEYTVEAGLTGRTDLPEVCRAHWYTERIESAQREHAPFFEEVERLTGLTGTIWQSGGMTMTMVVPIPGDKNGARYLGLREGTLDDGRWVGSIGFYATENTEEPEDVLLAYETDEGPMTPQQWAARLADDFAHARRVK